MGKKILPMCHFLRNFAFDFKIASILMRERILKFAIFGNEYQQRKAAPVERLLRLLATKNAAVAIHRPFFDFLSNNGMMPDIGCEVFDGNGFEADFAVSIGGDGTFLRTATIVGPKNIPVIGINVGRLGFLADVLPDNIEVAFGNLFDGKFEIADMTVLTLHSDNADIGTLPYALNDIAVLKRDNAAMISIKATINGEHLTTYQADGLIVSTPTGSTAYSLSNGGPIIVPDTPTLCLTPVAPHSLTSRPVVLSEDNVISLQVESRSHNFLVAVDGRSVTMAEGTTVTITRAPFRVHIVKNCGHNYFASLRRKMMWGADNRD